MIIKVSMPVDNQVQARVTTKDGKLNMKVPADLVSRRFADKRVLVGFFNATFDDAHILEIGDHVYVPEKERW